MHSILITGGAGFIGGSYVRQRLNAKDAFIINLDKLTYAGNTLSLPQSETTNYSFIQGDIGNTELVNWILKKYEPQFVVNFAAETHVDRSIDGPMEFVRTNVVGTVNLLESSLKYWKILGPSKRPDFRFLQVSTDEVYGSLGADGLFNEESPYSPNSPYSASKASADHFVRAWNHTFELPILITNCSNNYGPYQYPEKLIPLIILNAVEGRPLPVYGDGRQVRDWLFVDDHCEAIHQVLLQGSIGECYNIGGNTEKTNMEVVHAICDVIDEILPMGNGSSRRNLIQHVPDRPGHDRRYAIDSSKIRKDLGWTPKRGFDSAIRETVEWYLSQGNSNWIASVRNSTHRQGLLPKQS